MSSPTRGSAVVTSITWTPEGTRLNMKSPTGTDTHLVPAIFPDPAAGRSDSAAVRRPLAMIIRYGQSSADCVLLGTSRRGPIRRGTSLASALALCDSGVHTVVVWDADDPINGS
jgi:hypothetical protein